MLRFADKERELAEAQAEIRALKLSERLREKAVEEVFSLLIDFFPFQCQFAMEYYLFKSAIITKFGTCNCDALSVRSLS